jgi:hypothetical protein
MIFPYGSPPANPNRANRSALARVPALKTVTQDRNPVVATDLSRSYGHYPKRSTGPYPHAKRKRMGTFLPLLTHLSAHHYLLTLIPQNPHPHSNLPPSPCS